MKSNQAEHPDGFSSKDPLLSQVLVSDQTDHDDLSLLLQQVDNAIALLDNERRLMRFSPKLAVILGLNPNQLTGRPYWDALLTEAMRMGQWTELETQVLRVVLYQACSTPTPFSLIRSVGDYLEVQITLTPSGGTLLVFRQLGAELAYYKRAEAEIRRQLVAIEATVDAIAILNTKGKFIYVNSAHLQLFGYHSLGEMTDKTWHDLYCSDEVRRLEQEIAPIVAQTQQWRGEAIARRKDGSTFIQELSLTLTKDGELVSICRDISDRKQTEAALRQAEEKYRSIFENAIEGIFQTTPGGRYLNVNPALAKIYGYDSPAEFISNIHDIQQQIYVDPNRRIEFVRQMQEQGGVSQFESQVYRRDGSTIWISENAYNVYDADGLLLYYEGTVEDITTRKQSEEQLLINAFYDSLTGLPNRALFMNRLKSAVSYSHRHPSKLFAVLFIDLDRFKLINDSLGHLMGDQLLINVSDRLQQCVRSGDTVARLGGDEFAILLEDIQDVNDAIRVAERIQEQLSLPFSLKGHEVFTSASVGITISRDRLTNQPYQHLEDLLRDADIAMYRAKHRGKACHEVFDSSLHICSLDQLQLETDLRWALERQEFELHYQPIVALHNRRIRGFEALLRWQHPKRGLVFPGEFIGVAEETGLILLLDDWVLREACRQMQQWQTAGLVDQTTSMSINLAGRQFANPFLMTQINQVLQETELEPQRLRVEITESVIMEDLGLVVDNLHRLKELGVQLCIDDFGTGYSSLSRLHSFPINTLKIDRSFINALGVRGEHWAIVKTILNLAESLSMSVIAEGVETVEQLVQLTALGCDYGQGYLFSSPVEALAATALLEKRQL